MSMEPASPDWTQYFDPRRPEQTELRRRSAAVLLSQGYLHREIEIQLGVTKGQVAKWLRSKRFRELLWIYTTKRNEEIRAAIRVRDQALINRSGVMAKTIDTAGALVSSMAAHYANILNKSTPQDPVAPTEKVKDDIEFLLKVSEVFRRLLREVEDKNVNEQQKLCAIEERIQQDTDLSISEKTKLLQLIDSSEQLMKTGLTRDEAMAEVLKREGVIEAEYTDVTASTSAVDQSETTQCETELDETHGKS